MAAVGIYLLWNTVGCEPSAPKADNGNFSSGTADYSKYVAIGNSLTAGVQSGGLKEANQELAYPRLIAQQLGIPSDEFTYNNFPDSGTAGTLVLLGFSTTTGSPIFRQTTASTTPENSLQPAPYENLGVPTAFLYDFLNATGTGVNSWSQTRLATTNPLFQPIVRGATQFANLKGLSPTFITFHLGNNDILGYATNGAGLNGNFAAIAGVPPHTPRSSSDNGVGTTLTVGYNFATGYSTAMDSLATLNADVVLVNIPYVTAIPYFTAVNKDSVTVNLNPLTKAKIYTQETNVQYVTLAASTVLGSPSAGIGDGNALTPYGLHPSDPLGGKYTLTVTEATYINTVIDAYNSTIAAEAAEHGWGLADVNAIFNQIASVSGPSGSGYNIGGGIRVKTDFISGGIFSYDGVHPSTLGYAILANEIIKAANENYGSSVPLLNLMNYLQ